MPQNNTPINLPSVEKLIQRLVAAENSQQKDIRITIAEGRLLTAELAMLTSRLGKAIIDINTTLENIYKESAADIEVRFDGGGFDKR